jgi:2-dehydropantoate 2-reductase
MDYKKIGIVGAGAIGGWMGAGLAQAGCDVSFLARGDSLQALKTKGLKL